MRVATRFNTLVAFKNLTSRPAVSCAKSGRESAGVTKGTCGMTGVSGSWGALFGGVEEGAKGRRDGDEELTAIFVF
jgi:hypothetical protein